MVNTSMIKIYNESYWHVDGVRYKNKFKALEAASNDLNRVEFYYANSTFDDLDWTKEPSQSWDSMLIQRAHQVRESFDYIRLWYSAGSDSQTMLNVFLFQLLELLHLMCLMMQII